MITDLSLEIAVNPLPTNDVYVIPQGDHGATWDVYIHHNGWQRVSETFYAILKLVTKCLEFLKYFNFITSQKMMYSYFNIFQYFPIFLMCFAIAPLVMVQLTFKCLKIILWFLHPRHPLLISPKKFFF